MKETEQTNGQKQTVSKKTWGLTALSYIALVIFCCFNENIMAVSNAQEAFAVLCNAFFLPGVVFAGVGALTWIASFGTYDMLGYGFRNFGLQNFIPLVPKAKYDSFYEYKQQKDAKGRHWFKNLLVVGLTGMGISLLMLVLYYFM